MDAIPIYEEIPASPRKTLKQKNPSPPSSPVPISTPSPPSPLPLTYKGMKEEEIAGIDFNYETRVGCFGWTRWIWFTVIGLYEVACYYFVGFVDERVNPHGKYTDYETAYPRLKIKRVTPSWIPYFKAGLVFFLIGVLILVHYFWYYLPVIGTVGDAFFIDDRTRVIYLQEVLTPMEITDFIGDFARAQNFGTQRKQMNNATTSQQLDEIGTRWNAITRDGDDIGDQTQTDSWSWLAHHTQVMGNGGTGFVAGATQSGLEWLSSTTNYGANQRVASSAIQQPIPVAPVLEFEERVCGFVPQYQRKAGNIRLKKNSYDMTKLILDLHNSFFTICKRLEDPAIHIAVTARGIENIKEFTKLKVRCQEHMAYISSTRHTQDELPAVCLSNVDFGITEPFVYSAVFGHQSMFFINPRVVPLRPGPATATNAAPSSSSSPSAQQQPQETKGAAHEDVLDVTRDTSSQNFFTLLDIVEPETSAIGKADAAFWKHPGINTSFDVKMPRAGIAISTWTLPTQTNLTAHYGDTFGSSLNSLINSRAMIVEEENKKETLAGMSTFDESTAAYISSTIDYINSKSDDFTGLSLINGVVFDKRLEIDQLKKDKVQDMKAALEIANSELSWGSLFFSERTKMAEALAQHEAQSAPLNLVHHDYLAVPHPHHVCVVKFLTKNALLNRYRQIYADYMAGLGDTSSRYPKPRFSFIENGNIQ